MESDFAKRVGIEDLPDGETFYCREIKMMLEAHGLIAESWGRRGKEEVDRIEQQLGVKLPASLRRFGTEVGNLDIDCFQIVVCGVVHPYGEYSCAGLTLREREYIPHIPSAFILIMEYAGVSYYSISGSEVIVAYESTRVEEGSELQSFNDLLSFIDWVMNEVISFEEF